MLRQAAEEPWLGKALHDLSQPLMALEWRLFMELMPGPEQTDADAVVSLRNAIAESHAQCERVIFHVRAMQETLHAQRTEASETVPL